MTEKKIYDLQDAREQSRGTTQYMAGNYIGKYSALLLWLLGVWKLLELVGVL